MSRTVPALESVRQGSGVNQKRGDGLRGGPFRERWRCGSDLDKPERYAHIGTESTRGDNCVSARQLMHEFAEVRRDSGHTGVSCSRQRRSNPHMRSIVFFVTVFLLIGIPAYAYGDPSGGLLFQMLMPMLAAIWGMWMIFAKRVQRGMTNLLRRLRGAEPEEPSAPSCEPPSV